MSNNALRIFKGESGNIHVFHDRVFLERRKPGFLTFLLPYPVGSKTIQIDSIAAIQIRPPGLFGASGFIQFTVPGCRKGISEVKQAESDENSISFSGRRLLSEVQEIHDLIFELKRKNTVTGELCGTAELPISQTRTCPFCAETVKLAATLCRYCQKELPQLEKPVLEETNSPSYRTKEVHLASDLRTVFPGTSKKPEVSSLLTPEKPLDKLVYILRFVISPFVALWGLCLMLFGRYGILGGLVCLSGAAILFPLTANFLAKYTSRWVKPGQAILAATGFGFIGTFIAVVFSLSVQTSQPPSAPLVPRVSPTGFDSMKRAAERKALWEQEEPKREAEAAKQLALEKQKKLALEKQKKQATAKANQAPKPKPARPQQDQTYPFKLVEILSQPMDMSGFQCFLPVDKGWQKSNISGWYAILRRSFGENEVSCLLESEEMSTVQRVELEAEFYQPGLYEDEMLMQFAQSAQVLMHPATPTQDFAEAVINKAPWSNGQWKMTTEDYANGGFGLTLRKL